MPLSLDTTEAAISTEAIRAAFVANPRQMTVQLARQLDVPEADVLRALVPDIAVELDAGRWEAIIRAFESAGQVHVIATNHAVTLEAFGSFGNFSTWDDYFNVQTKSLDMHIRWKELASVFAVEKPSHMDGVSTLSIQFFDTRGSAAFKVFFTFGSKAPRPEARAAFDALRKEFQINS